MNRREFLIQAGAAAGTTVLLDNFARAATPGFGAGVTLVCDPSDPVVAAKPAQWAARQLQDALTARGIVSRSCAQLDEAGPSDFCIVAAGPGHPLAHASGIVPPTEPESLVIAPGRAGRRELLWACGSDPRGLAYALAELADAVALGDPARALRPAQTTVERPANSVRSVMRLFASDVEDKPWFNDRGFWSRYFDLLASLRFNRFNLALGLGYDQPVGLRDTYFYFAYPFFVAVPGYEVRATNLPDAERDQNLAMLRWISSEAARRGLDFQLGLWTHAYQWRDSPHVNHVIEGLTPQTHAPYCRDALARVLEACPDITGVTMRIHGESGVPEGSYNLWRTIFDGCVRGGRRVPLDLHAKGMDQATLDAAQSCGSPLTISPKFWAEHMGLPYHQAAIRPTEMPSGKPGKGAFTQSEGARSFLRYGYGDLLREDRHYAIVHRVWPGTQRVLLWGDPVFAAAYCRVMGLCGSSGCEVFDPLSFKGRKGSGIPGGRDGYADATLRAPGDDFEKFRFGYRLWGRLLYNPDTPRELLDRQLAADYGPRVAPDAGRALARASRILPLFTTAHCPSAANNNYWPEMYINMAIADAAAPVEPYADTLLPRRFGTVSPLDPKLFSRVEDFADELLAGRVGGKYSPIEVAQWLEDLAQAAHDSRNEAEAKATNPHAPAFRRFSVDVKVLIGLGRFFGGKLRAAVLFAIYQRTGEPAARAKAIEAYRNARGEWAHIVEITKEVYVADISYGEGWFQRGHWSDRIAAIDRDILAMGQAPASAPGAPIAPGKVAKLIADIGGRPQRWEPGAIRHSTLFGVAQGRPVALRFDADGWPADREVKLHYRRMNQAEVWRMAPMRGERESYSGEIPGDYVDGIYPLQYYFEVTDGSGRAVLIPGLGGDLTRQPYYILRPGLPANHAT